LTYPTFTTDEKAIQQNILPKVQAEEVSFELHSLGWKAFQNLCVTIISDIWGQEVQAFSDSHDGGRDGAFYGSWNSKDGKSFESSFTMQCKFTAKEGTNLHFSNLKDEHSKAHRLATRGLAKNYFLFTNARVTATTEETIREKYEAIPGIKHFRAYGYERISQIIRESPRLRMLVPRVYGLGDLSQILDERAYTQAREILSVLKDDLAKFVITDAYRKSANALIEHNFVLLLGEPASGKSTIAAALSLGALDQWGCSIIKVRDPNEFVKHSNPYEQKQFFWVDDCFGITQLDGPKVFLWNGVFPHLQAAIRRGARVLFTSRDYIYRSALQYLKVHSFPLINESQVVINIEKITIEEREQILYNHIRLGTQLKEFKSRIKTYLPEIASHQHFSPEIARRLGNQMFTRQLNICRKDLDDFVACPLEFLCEIIRTLDAESRSAIALIFMRAGTLSSPVDIIDNEQQAISRLGGSIGGITTALNSLNGSLIIQTFQDNGYVWRFKHPTISEAYAKIVAEDTELMDIYLTGAPIEKLFDEVSCGDVGIQGVKVIVPASRFEAIITKIASLDILNRDKKKQLHWFLVHRCNREFLSQYVKRCPEFITTLRVGSFLNAVSDVEVIVRLHEFGLLPEEKRLEVVSSIRYLAIDTPDSGFLKKGIRDILTLNELSDILQEVRISLIPKLDDQIDDWRGNFSSDIGLDPVGYFEELKCALKDYRNEFLDSKDALDQIDTALAQIDREIDYLLDEYPKEPDYDYDEDDYIRESLDSESDAPRSIFDDVDF
jgi:energy-coupling factor transporter ATP-binding protein EcfA2